jgi:alkanesulfonate monooxygenase SsuD/methylene tetrahydromethanopterin reductase-like flavin-dependent oxidoreductase (luciferase family)
MRFGINFFPTVEPREKSAATYFDECLDLAERADALGYNSIRIVEHYFRSYGGYSPDPVTFLSAVSQRTRQVRLVTGAVLPAFNHPLKLAGKLAMLDNLSHGRLEAGFARAFLPEEFDAFQVSMEESRPRFEEVVGVVKRLWTEEDVVHEGRFYRFGPLTMLPRPFQAASGGYPPIWIAAITTPESFVWAGEQGYGLMIVPYLSAHADVAKLVELYRLAWREAGYTPGQERVTMSFHLYLAEDGDQAREEAREYLDDYVAKFLLAAEAWNGRRTAQYRGYEQLTALLRSISYERVLAETKAFVGSPDEVTAQLELIRGYYGEVEPSLQVNHGNMPPERAHRSLELFGREVMPRFQNS